MSRKNAIPKPPRQQTQDSRKLAGQHSQRTLSEFHDGKMMFSFVHFDRDHDAFNCGGTTTAWYIQLLDTVKHVSSLSRIEFENHQRQHYDVHRIDWDSVKYRFNTPMDLEQVDCYQFRLSQAGGRVQGFMIENRFYIVWLDPHHNLYPDERFGGTKYFAKPLNAYQELEIRCAKLEEENKSLMELLDERTS